MTSPGNLWYLKELCRDLTPEQIARVGNILVGILSVHVLEETWQECVQRAVRLAIKQKQP